MAAFTRHLAAAQGWLELGLPLDAWNELEEIEPERRAEVAVLARRVAIYQHLGRWREMMVVAEHLIKVQPEEPGWPVALAYATRRTEGLALARGILLHAARRFPKVALLPYNLACYAAQLGEIEEARRHLQRAFALDACLRVKALEDPDLEPLWSDGPWP